MTSPHNKAQITTMLIQSAYKKIAQCFLDFKGLRMQWPLRGIRFITLTLFITVSLTACIAIKLTYHQADRILSWYADDYFDLNRDQVAALKIQLAPLLQWHRRTQLPDYVQLISQIEKKLQGPIDVEDAHWLNNQLKQRYLKIAEEISRPADSFLFNLSPQNLKALRKKFSKDNRKYIQENQLDESLESQQEARVDRLYKNIEEWTGRLTRAQKEIIQKLLNLIPATEKLRLEEHRLRQKALLKLWDSVEDRAVFNKGLHDWLTQWDMERTLPMAQQFNDTREQKFKLYVKIYQMLSTEQRQNILTRLIDLKDDLLQLSNES